MNQLMLLAQLSGEGEATEAKLRTRGFEDLDSVAGADLQQLSEALEISKPAASRMIRKAEELLKTSSDTVEDEDRTGPGLDPAPAPSVPKQSPAGG